MVYSSSGHLRKARVALWAATFCLLAAPRLLGDPIPVPAEGLGTSGIFLDAKGAIHFHDPTPKEMEEARAKAMKPAAIAKDEKLCYISLARIIPIIKELQLREKPVPEELQYMGGLTQIRYVFAYPDEREFVIVGPCEPWDKSNPVEPVGKITGRPIIQFDDLVAAMRTARSMRRSGENGGNFGCSINPAKGVEDRIAKVMKEYSTKPRPEKMVALTKAIGPQEVKIFNTNENTRLAFVCVAADCKMKRFALGLEQAPVPGIGTIVENTTRIPNSHVWFELAYEPILMSEDGFAFELRGPRLQVKAGEDEFNDKDATHRAVGFAKQMNEKMPKLCAAIPVFADLQNMADCAVVATLIKMDKLDEKVKWDAMPVQAVIGWSIQTVPVPKTVDTQVAYTNGALCHGGISFGGEILLDPDTRKPDKKGMLTPIYESVKKMLEDTKAGPILAAP